MVLTQSANTRAQVQVISLLNFLKVEMLVFPHRSACLAKVVDLRLCPKGCERLDSFRLARAEIHVAAKKDNN